MELRDGNVWDRDVAVGDRNATMGTDDHKNRNGTLGTESVYWGEMGPTVAEVGLWASRMGLE